MSAGTSPSAVLSLAILALFQAPLPSPPGVGRVQDREPAPAGVEQLYGPLQVVDLEDIAGSNATFQRRLVLTRGVVRDLVPGRYLSLEQGTARVMLIFFEGAYDDYDTMRGMDVDVTGVVRVLPAVQPQVPCRGVTVPQSKCEDWDLPLLPDKQPQWPAVSLSVTRMVDRGTGDRPRGEGKRTDADRVIGQFRGANLCRDLPVESRRDPADWVLLTPSGPLWVTGRRSSGRGFHLDPAYRGDTSRWLEVSGKVQVVGTVRYLKAGSVALIARPQEIEAVPCPP